MDISFSSLAIPSMCFFFKCSIKKFSVFHSNFGFVGFANRKLHIQAGFGEYFLAQTWNQFVNDR
jgi:hypothetical protein